MDTENGVNASSDFKTDHVRKYSVQDPNIRNNFTCTFCLKVTKGGASRMKRHLVGGFPNVTMCPQCPDHVRKEMIRLYENETRSKGQHSDGIKDTGP